MEVICVCWKAFNLDEGVDIVPDHLDKSQHLCKGSGKSVEEVDDMVGKLLAESKEGPNLDCAAACPLLDCDACNSLSRIPEVKVSEIKA